MASHRPQSILILAANPLDTQPLRLDQEVREIQNSLRGSRRKFKITQQWATRAIDVRRALLDHKPTFVHFCGHGGGRNGIVLEDNSGQSKHANGDALAALFALFPNIQCVVLNACYSAIQAEAISQQIDHVVGINSAISDVAALEFSSAFYDALGSGESVDFAFKMGQNAIQFAGLPEQLAPILLQREPSPVIQPIPEISPIRRGYWSGAPAVPFLFGRDSDVAILRRWILEESCRVVLVTGLGGIGKTDLVVYLGRGLDANSYSDPDALQSFL
jgi:hypothetical protein